MFEISENDNSENDDDRTASTPIRWGQIVQKDTNGYNENNQKLDDQKFISKL